jgi:ribosomal protein S14
MNTQRDLYLRLEVRKQNWLRLEFYRRFVAQRFLYKRVCLRALARDAGLVAWQPVAISLSLARLPRQSRMTRAKTRCRVTGRTHQASRNINLARMEFRRVMREGSLAGFKLGRT